jgi:hypothetical protein
MYWGSVLPAYPSLVYLQPRNHTRLALVRSNPPAAISSSQQPPAHNWDQSVKETRNERRHRRSE